MSEYLPAESVEPAALHAFLDRCRRPDGSDALSEHKATRVGRRGEVHEVVGVGPLGALESYAQAAWHGQPGSQIGGHWAVEVATDPGSPARADVAGLVGSLRMQLPEGPRVAVWAFNDTVAADLAAAGYEETRRLLRLEAQLPLETKAVLPGRVRLERFVAGRDEAAWLELNNTAFSGHPENGALEHDDVAERLRHDWFDPEGFLMAWDGPRLVGSCWTKLHDGAVGEIYIIAVHPDEQGRGIGRALVASGAGYLERVRGARRLMLYTEGGNEAALSLYKALGFEVGAVSNQMELIDSGESQPNR